MKIIFTNPKEESKEPKKSRWWIAYHLLIGIILYSWIKASGLYELILSFFYIGSDHKSATFYGLMAALITLLINFSGYHLSKKVIKSIKQSKLSNSSQKRFIILFPIIFFIILGFLFYIPYTLIEKEKAQKMKYSYFKNEEENVVTAISVENSKGLKESDFNLTTLKKLEEFYTKRMKQKVDNFLIKHGYTAKDLNLRISSNSYYINVEGKKIAVIKIKIHDFGNSVFIIGIIGNDLIKVFCSWENYKEEISIFTGKCGKEIAKAFGISLPLQYMN
ncbi:hypothetical protein [Thermodesulfovibrio yellowstonii]|uniref:hypothetical protein n=1 Tax=Thermodesulfovibrio yellowstonii TaxID=28262 RepID=UPI003C7ED4A6